MDAITLLGETLLLDKCKSLSFGLSGTFQAKTELIDVLKSTGASLIKSARGMIAGVTATVELWNWTATRCVQIEGLKEEGKKLQNDLNECAKHLKAEIQWLNVHKTHGKLESEPEKQLQFEALTEPMTEVLQESFPEYWATLVRVAQLVSISNEKRMTPLLRKFCRASSVSLSRRVTLDDQALTLYPISLL